MCYTVEAESVSWPPMTSLVVVVVVVVVAAVCVPDAPCRVVPRGDGRVPERAAGDLGQPAVPARALPVHPEAAQRLRGGLPPTAAGGGPGD